MDIEIYEVGARDGIQNSSFPITTKQKIQMIEMLYEAGLKNMEITSFVNPKYVPKMADAKEVFEATKELDSFGVLIPNQKGMDRAREVGAEKINVFFSPSNNFNYRNLGTDLKTAYGNIENMLIDTDREKVRAYISCAFGCPFEGMPKEHQLIDALEKASAIAETVVLCDTIGASYPTKMLTTLELTKKIDSKIALHLHENRVEGNDIFANVKSALDWGITSFDSSINGLGGCPFIPNSGSNLSTNQLIHWAENNNYETGIELNDLREVTSYMHMLEKGLPEGFITDASPVAI